MDEKTLNKKLKTYKPFNTIYTNLYAIDCVIICLFFISLIIMWRMNYLDGLNGSNHLYDKVMCFIESLYNTFITGIVAGIVGVIILLIFEFVLEHFSKKYISFYTIKYGKYEGKSTGRKTTRQKQQQNTYGQTNWQQDTNRQRYYKQSQGWQQNNTRTSSSNYNNNSNSNYTNNSNSSYSGNSDNYSKNTAAKQIDKKYEACLAVFGFQNGDTIYKDELNKKRKTLMKKYHPDMAGGSEEKCKIINESYDYLLKFAS